MYIIELLSSPPLTKVSGLCQTLSHNNFLSFPPLFKVSGLGRTCSR